MDLPAELNGVPGTKLPVGRFEISVDENRVVTNVVRASIAANGTAHPIWAFIATYRGVGVSFAELCAIANFDVADGPILSSWQVHFDSELRPGISYGVTGVITELVRKRGRSGTFDLMTVVERLIDEDDILVATTSMTLVLPRRSESA